MSACPEFEGLLIDRLASALDPAEEKQLEEHLAHCARCTEEDRALRETLEQIALPPVTLKEQVALAAMPSRTLFAWRAGERRRQMAWGAALGFGVAAAAAIALVMMPVGRGRYPTGTRSGFQGAEVADDATLRALENWGAGESLAEWLPAEGDGLEIGDDDQGVDW